MKESEHFIFGESHPKEDAGGGITRQIMGYNNELMRVKNWFEEGAIGYVDEHIH